MSQNFTVVETQTEKKGVFVKVEETVRDVKAILDGKVDSLTPEDLMFIGTLEDLKEKLAKKAAEKDAKANEDKAKQAPIPQAADVAQSNGSPQPNGTDPAPATIQQPSNQPNQKPA